MNKTVAGRGLALEELEAESAVELPDRELLATLSLSVLGLINVSATASASVSVLGLINAQLT